MHKDTKIISKFQILINRHSVDYRSSNNDNTPNPTIVYAKKPFSGVNSVVEYLGRYTHKIAISNHRITDFDEKKQTVTFNYKD